MSFSGFVSFHSVFSKMNESVSISVAIVYLSYVLIIYSRGRIGVGLRSYSLLPLHSIPLK